VQILVVIGLTVQHQVSGNETMDHTGSAIRV